MRIGRIRLENIKGFKTLDFSIPDAGDGTRGDLEK